ncbi:endonuclease/exonuclease/phosphatase family protein [Streptomyces cavernae]|uniref:endonuclease/exonuclease/phosphatase family protein n=1 Tax=Streptomyces cavernae TaxID=2259034 RepID=UPI003B75BF75
MESSRVAYEETVERVERHGGRVYWAWIAGLLLLGVGAVVGCRLADTDGITPVPQLLAFLPWLLAPTGLALLLAFLARWRIGMLWAMVTLALLAWFSEPYGKTMEVGGTAVAELRVLTSNVKFGQATESLIAAVQRQRPDLVFVQECEYTCSDALKKAFADDAYPYRQAVEGQGSDGSVILSRYPLKATDGVPGTMGMPGAVADVEGREVRLQLAHPMPPLPDQLRLWRSELGALRAYAARTKGPTILAGDFNASQDHAAFRRILDTGLRDAARLAGEARTPTWPTATAPPLGAQIDHILVSRQFLSREVTFLDLKDTDHRAVLADLTLFQG